ncbi:MAG: metal ABC transporter ATP-binding protein [Solirubrobacterales bacterium]
MINIDNMNFSYTGETPFILNKINLHIEKGSYMSILGDNGCAKTTLIKLMLRLLIPCTGSISVNTSKIGYVPQHVENINSQFPITVNEILKCHYKVLKLNDSNEIKDVLNLMSIYSLRNNLLSTLSGGQVQKVFIARALLGNPELLILDEPSTGIDMQSQQEIYFTLKDLSENHNITVVSVEHNLQAALKYSTHICKIENGTSKVFPISDYLEGAYPC